MFLQDDPRVVEAFETPRYAVSGNNVLWADARPVALNSEQPAAPPEQDACAIVVDPWVSSLADDDSILHQKLLRGKYAYLAR